MQNIQISTMSIKTLPKKNIVNALILIEFIVYLDKINIFLRNFSFHKMIYDVNVFHSFCLSLDFLQDVSHSNYHNEDQLSPFTIISYLSLFNCIYF